MPKKKPSGNTEDTSSWPTVRVHPDLHQSAKVRAAEERVHLQDLVALALKRYLGK